MEAIESLNRNDDEIICEKEYQSSIPNMNKVKNFLKAIEEQFATFDKVLANTLMKTLSSMKFDHFKGVCEHIMETRHCYQPKVF